MTAAQQTCPKCGTTLSGEAFGGLCWKCLGRLGFGLAETHNLEQIAPMDRDTSPKPDSARLKFGDYELIEEIARGGMGVVYKARQITLNRLVAVKMVLHGPFSSEEFVRRFRTETQAVAALHHPNIVAIYEVGHQDGQHYFSMEYIEGQSLADLVREKPLSPHRAAVYLKAIAEAMQSAHEHGVLHRDLKPSNVLLDVFDQPRITDFGLAKLTTDSRVTITGQTLGSPGHMPPEQARGDAPAPQADIYSMGALLYHLVTGRPPFQGDTLEGVLLQLQTTDPVSPRRLNPSMPADLETICLKCLQKEPSRRYESAKALAQDLDRFLNNEPVLARPVAIPEKLWLWCRRRPVPAGLSGALLLAMLAGISGVVWEWRQARNHALGEIKQRQLAESSAAKIRLNLYAADVNLASEAMQRGDYGLARRTLASLVPQPGEEDVRGFEWRLLWNLCRGNQLATLTGHERTVTCANFSPDGQWLATGSSDQTVRIWDATKLKPIRTLSAATGAVWSVAFSADTTRLITSGRGGTRLWDTATWHMVTNLPGQITAVAPTGSVMAVCDSSRNAWRAPGAISLWDWRTGEKLRAFAKAGHQMAFSWDGRKLAVAAEPTGIDVWDTASSALLHSLSTSNSVWGLAFSPDGKRLVSVSGPRDPLVWDLTEPQPPRTLKGHFLTVWSANYSPDGAVIVTTGADQTVRLWDAETLQLKTILRGHDNEVWSSCFSPDGKKLATGGKDRKVMIWPGELRSPSESLPNRIAIRPLFSPDGIRIGTVGFPGAPSGLWNVRDRRLIAEIPGRSIVGFTPDGQQIVHWNADASGLERYSPTGGSTSVVMLEEFRTRSGEIQRYGFSPEWKVLFVVDSAGLVRFWNAESGKLTGSFQGPRPPLRSVALGPDGRYFAEGAEQENIVRLYDRSTGRERRLTGHSDAVSGLAFSPDRATLASGSLDGSIRFWNVATGEDLGSLPGHMQEASDVAFSPDGRTLASVNLRHSIKLWHIPTRRELLTFEFSHAGDIVQFSPDGRTLTVTTDENTVRLFDAPALTDERISEVAATTGADVPLAASKNSK